MRTNGIIINSQQFAAIRNLQEVAMEAQHVVESFAQLALSHNLASMHAEACDIRERLRAALIECRAESVGQR